jgi:hypothetical protein
MVVDGKQGIIKIKTGSLGQQRLFMVVASWK